MIHKIIYIFMIFLNLYFLLNLLSFYIKIKEIVQTKFFNLFPIVFMVITYFFINWENI